MLGRGLFSRTKGDDVPHRAELMQRMNYVVVGLTVYSVGLLMLSLLIAVQLWPASQHLTENHSQVRILRWRVTLSLERHLLLIVIAMGMLGAATDSVWWLAYQIQEGRFQPSESLGFLVKPWMGCVIAVLFYALLRGGLISGSAGSKEINVYGLAGMAGLAGLSATKLVTKLVNLLP